MKTKIALVVMAVIILWMILNKLKDLKIYEFPKSEPRVVTTTTPAVTKPIVKPKEVEKPKLVLATHELSEFELEVVKLVNQKRSNTLKISNHLNSIAFYKTQDMVNKGYWAHVSPTGEGIQHIASDSGYKYVEIGENLVMNFQTPEGIVQGWMNSPTHRDNILTETFVEVGVAQYGNILVMVFVQKSNL